jgi:cytochrome b561
VSAPPKKGFFFCVHNPTNICPPSQYFFPGPYISSSVRCILTFSVFGWHIYCIFLPCHTSISAPKKRFFFFVFTTQPIPAPFLSTFFQDPLLHHHIGVSLRFLFLVGIFIAFFSDATPVSAPKKKVFFTFLVITPPISCLLPSTFFQDPLLHHQLGISLRFLFLVDVFIAFFSRATPVSAPKKKVFFFFWSLPHVV